MNKTGIRSKIRILKSLIHCRIRSAKQFEGKLISYGLTSIVIS